MKNIIGYSDCLDWLLWSLAMRQQVAMEFGYEATGGMVSGGWWAELEVCMCKKKKMKIKSPSQ